MIETKVIKPQLKFEENLTDYIILDTNTENELDTNVKNIKDLMTNNVGKGKSDEEKEELYSKGKVLWKEYSDALQGARYNFYLNKSQLKFLTDLINTKLEYDVNTVFIAIELTQLMSSMKDTKYTNDYELKSFSPNATEVTYVYHLISTYKVKGLVKDAYTFSEILRKIGDISKVFNYYEEVGKQLSADVQDWVACFEEGVTQENTLEVETSN